RAAAGTGGRGGAPWVTVDTRAMWLVLEALGPMSAIQMTGTGEHLMGLIQALCPGARIETARSAIWRMTFDSFLPASELSAC
ncbi:hypothetical protein, partial [Mesorhizobium sp. M0910]|uniref:hypothetical protein n=1 Tax=Mesorhizobium sp. M0910 TaxID=2957025 RepID=UPI00333C8554